MIVTKLLAIASVLAVLGGAIRFARARSRDVSGSSDQSRRILLPALVFAIGVTVYAFFALLGGANASFVIMTTIAVLIAHGTGALLLISATDVAAKAMGAQRTRAWLIAGMGLFIGGVALETIVSMLAISGLGIAALLDLDVAALIALAAAAALIWWSFLPVEPPVAGVFE